jgi:squalene cyclase
VARAEVKMDEETKKACERALKWLAKKQNQDGSWSDGAYQHNTAITAFTLLAFMSQGHLPNKGHYAPEVTKGTDFLIASQREDGYLVGARGGNMYCHGMATLALAELWGSTGDNKVKPVLEKAIKLIEGSQNSQGGWRYEPRPTGADISVTIMQVMALRAAYNAGLDVKKETIDKAIKYIESCYDSPTGGFTYQPGNRSPGFARTAAGICVLYLTGRAAEYLKEPDATDPKSKKVNLDRAVSFLKKKIGLQTHYWYGVYYGAHAMYQYGQEKGKEKEWDDWYTALVKELLPKQKVTGDEGYWQGSDVGPIYGTSIAVIVLSVPTHYLPIFQR